MEEYEGDYYFSQFKGKKTDSLKKQESELRNRINQLREQARSLESDADYMLWEQNYRKHITTLKLLQEKEDQLLEIINNPSTTKTKKAKAEREENRIYKAFWGLMKYGAHCDPKKNTEINR
jgi:hypothetical protein